MEVKIRHVTKEDAAHLLEHTKKVINESTFLLTSPDEFTLTVDQEEEWIENHSNQGNLLIVAEIDGRIIGNLNFQTKKHKRLSHIGYFGISIQEEYCNRGIGRSLLTYLLQWAKLEPGLEKVCLEVFSHNDRAIHLYKKLGFQEEGRKVKFVKLSESEYADEILMYKFVK
ncbi:N-acetyltransferase family protein [Ferdinandcohnia sp. Marseille-Q9671]